MASISIFLKSFFVSIDSSTRRLILGARCKDALYMSAWLAVSERTQCRNASESEKNQRCFSCWEVVFFPFISENCLPLLYLFFFVIFDNAKRKKKLRKNRVYECGGSSAWATTAAVTFRKSQHSCFSPSFSRRSFLFSFRKGKKKINRISQGTIVCRFSTISRRREGRERPKALSPSETQ